MTHPKSYHLLGYGAAEEVEISIDEAEDGSCFELDITIKITQFNCRFYLANLDAISGLLKFTQEFNSKKLFGEYEVTMSPRVILAKDSEYGDRFFLKSYGDTFFWEQTLIDPITTSFISALKQAYQDASK